MHVECVCELVVYDVSAVACVLASGERVLPAEDDWSSVVCFAEPALEWDRCARSCALDWGGVGGFVDDDCSDSWVVVVLEVEEEDGGLGCDCDFDFVGDCEVSAGLPPFFVDDDSGDVAECALFVFVEDCVVGDVSADVCVPFWWEWLCCLASAPA